MRLCSHNAVMMATAPGPDSVTDYSAPDAEVKVELKDQSQIEGSHSYTDKCDVRMR